MAIQSKLILCNSLGQYAVQGDPPTAHHSITSLLEDGWVIVSSLALPPASVSDRSHFIQYILIKCTDPCTCADPCTCTAPCD